MCGYGCVCRHVHTCVFGCGCVHWVMVPLKSKREHQASLVLHLQEIVSCPSSVLGTKHRSSARPGCAPNPWASSFFFKRHFHKSLYGSVRIVSKSSLTMNFGFSLTRYSEIYHSIISYVLLSMQCRNYFLTVGFTSLRVNRELLQLSILCNTWQDAWRVAGSK